MRTVGGVGFYLDGRPVATVSSPLMVLDIDESGVRVTARHPVVHRGARLLQLPGFHEPGVRAGEPVWQSAWSEMIAVEFVRARQIAFFSTSAYELRFGCRRGDVACVYDHVPLGVVFPPPQDAAVQPAVTADACRLVATVAVGRPR